MIRREILDDAHLTAHRVRSRMREARHRLLSTRQPPLPDVLAEWEIDGHMLELRIPRHADHRSWRAARLANQAQIEPHWDPQDRSWAQRHGLGDFVDHVKEAARGRRSHGALINVLVRDGEVMGEMSLAWIHHESRSAEVSVWLDRRVGERQITDSAFAALTDFAFHGLDLVRLAAPVSVHNPAAQSAVDRVGFGLEGVMRWYRNVGGERIDHQLWSLIRPDETVDAPADAPASAPCFDRSIAAQARLHEVVPGGAHTYARGEDQYPDGMAPVIARGLGSHVWDLDGNEFIEYGAGLRSVTLGHAFKPVTDAVRRALSAGNSFSRPSRMELDAAEDFLRTVPTAEMVKFAKNGSDVTTAAIRLARAATGRMTIAMCAQPFFSVDDWFIGTTAMRGGTRPDDSVSFPYNDIDALRAVLAGGDVAAVIMEAATGTCEPDPGYLQAVRDLCTAHGTVLIFDEMITGFRWSAAGAQSVYDVTPDLSCWGKALGNGFPISALAGRRDLMEAGGLNAPGERVFLLSTTHGPESASLAAMRAVIETYAESDPVSAMETTGQQLKSAINGLAHDHGIGDHLYIDGRPSCLVFVTKDVTGVPSQEFRTLVMSGLISRGVLGQSLVNSAAHTSADVEQTVEAFAGVMPYYRKALEDGSARPFFAGRPVTPAIRGTAEPRTPFRG